MKYFLNLFLITSLSMMGCNSNSKSTAISSEANIPFLQNIKIGDLSTIQKSKPNIKLLDVRTPKETSMGIINGALEIDFRAKDFKEKVNKLDRSESYVVYCKSGGRSSKAADIMQQMGFSSIYNLEGGYDAFVSKK